jgi:hypothetical protein
MFGNRSDGRDIPVDAVMEHPRDICAVAAGHKDKICIGDVQLLECRQLPFNP